MELNLPIARKIFMTLILDYESEYGVYCRILNDGWYYGQLTAPNVETAIEKFMNGQFVHRM